MTKSERLAAIKDAPPRTPRKPIQYEAILKEIEGRLGQSLQWSDLNAGADYCQRSVKYLYEAECLIELLETHNCGSVGGFDRHRGLNQRKFGRGLLRRVEWLKKVR